MHITKKSSYIISFLIVLSFFGMGALFVNFQTDEEESDTYSVQIQDKSEIPLGEAGENQESADPVRNNQINVDSPPGNEEGEAPTKISGDEGFALKDFHRSETRDGKLLWEVVGKNARYYPEEKRVDVETCVFSMIDKKGKPMVLRAGKAKLYLHGPSLESAFFSAQVTLDYGTDLKIITPEATYEHQQGYVTTDAHVNVIGEWYTVEGDGLRAHLGEKKYEILNNVSSVIEPQKKARNDRT